MSAVSVWEIAIKRSLRKLTLGPRWHVRLSRLAFAEMPITAEHVRRVEDLPWHHKDPFDRLLVAQALAEDHDLVTADAQLAAYGVRLVW